MSWARKWIELPVLVFLAAIAVWDGVRVATKNPDTPNAGEAGGYLVLLGSLLACLATTYAIQLHRGRLEAGFAAGMGSGTKRVCIAPVIFLAYIVLMAPLGYVLSTAIFFVASFRAFGSYRWLPVIVSSFLMAGTSAYFWSALGMMLPTGILGWP